MVRRIVFFAQSIVNVYLEYTKIHIKGILKDLKFWHEKDFREP